MQTKATHRYLKNFAQRVVYAAKNIVKNSKHSGKLLDSLKYSLVKTDKGFSVKFLSAEHGNFMEKGVSGTEKRVYYKDIKGKRRQSPFKFKKQPPSKAIDKWVASKVSGARDEETGKFIPRKSLTFLIGRSMKRYGIPVVQLGASPDQHMRRGLSYYTKPLKKNLKDFPKELMFAFKEDLLAGIKEIKTK